MDVAKGPWKTWRKLLRQAVITLDSASAHVDRSGLRIVQALRRESGTSLEIAGGPVRVGWRGLWGWRESPHGFGF